MPNPWTDISAIHPSHPRRQANPPAAWIRADDHQVIEIEPSQYLECHESIEDWPYRRLRSSCWNDSVGQRTDRPCSREDRTGETYRIGSDGRVAYRSRVRGLRSGKVRPVSGGPVSVPGVVAQLARGLEANSCLGAVSEPGSGRRDRRFFDQQPLIFQGSWYDRHRLFLCRVDTCEVHEVLCTYRRLRGSPCEPRLTWTSKT